MFLNQPLKLSHQGPLHFQHSEITRLLEVNYILSHVSIFLLIGFPSTNRGFTAFQSINAFSAFSGSTANPFASAPTVSNPFKFSAVSKPLVPTTEPDAEGGEDDGEVRQFYITLAILFSCIFRKGEVKRMRMQVFMITFSNS